jgi:hypothetical protein
MRHSYSTTNPDVAHRRWGKRICLQKECGRLFQATTYNQRYCKDPDCRKRVKAWQATKRQRNNRSHPEKRQQHAAAERERRKRRASESPRQPQSAATADASEKPGAWSRRPKLPEVFCDRPGCYRPVRRLSWSAVSYCGKECRRALERVRDRQRKSLWRKTKEGRRRRQLEYRARCSQRRATRHIAAFATPWPSSAGVDQNPLSVLFSGHAGGRILNWAAPKEVVCDDPEENLGSRPRAPPSS